MRFSSPRFVRRFTPTRLHLAGLAAGMLLAGAPDPAQAQVDPQTGSPTSAVAASLPDSPLAQAIWSAAALQQILAERDYPAVLSMALLNRSASDPDASGSRLETLAATLSASLTSPPGGALARCRGLQDPVEGTLCSLEALVPLLPAAEGRGLADEGARLLGLYLQPGQAMIPGVAGLSMPAAAGGEGRRLAPLQAFAQGVVEDALRNHVSSLVGPGDGGQTVASGPGGTFTAALSGILGFSPASGTGEVLAQVPELRALLRAHPGIASLESTAGGTLQATLVDGESLLQEYQGFLTSVTGSARGLLDQRFMQVLAGEGVDAEGTSVMDWAAQRSFVYLASRTASLVGLESGVSERIRALGNAATDLRQEGFAFRANLTQFGQQAAMAALTGNVFTLASGVATFFQMNPNALGGGAAGEVRALRGLVDDLRGEMAEGFEGVDARLDEVMGTLDQGFGRMEALVAQNRREVLNELGALGDELAALGGRVDRLDANLVAYLQAGFDRDYSRTLIRCLEHRERHLPPFDRMEFGVFSECLTDFRARGARDARDALLTDRTTPVDDRSLADALADESPENLARRLPLVARAAEQRLGDTGMGGGRGGANPVEWAVASQAYLAMLQDWPDYAAGVRTGDLEALLGTGVETLRILEGTTGVLSRVLADYEEGVTNLTEEADQLARRHQQAQLRRVDPATLLNVMTPEALDHPTLPAPRRVAGNIPAEVRTAAVLALEEPVLVYRTMTTDSITTGNERRRFLFFGRLHDRYVHTRTRMVVELRVDGGEVVSRFRTEGPMVLRRIDEMSGREGGDQVRSSDVRIADPERHFLAEHLPALSADVSAWQVAPADPAVLRRLEVAIEEELRRYESASLNRIFGSVCVDGPLDAELTGPDRESAERIRASVERLTTARLLLGTLVRLGLPDAPAEDETLRTLLFGADGLLDRGALCRVVAAGDSPLRLVWIEQEPRERATLLARALEEAVAREQADGRPPSMVEATIQQLRAAIRLQELRARIAG
ncbi:MAG: hypothetical protein EA350_15060 [Gemmatimonadales bacterium]|nr:MAG: hypothetical protein EA350_15060 [Gemmatimonadales bacterium]